MKKIIYLSIIALVIPFLIINTNAISNIRPYAVLSVFSTVWPYLLIELIIFILLLIYLQKRCKLSKTHMSDLTSEIKKSDNNYELLFENMIVAIAVVQGSKIVMVNHELEKLTGYKKEELLNSTVNKTIYPDDLERVLTIHKEIIKSNKQKINYTFRIKRSNNEIRYIQSDIVKIVWNHKPAILALMLDITEQVQAKNQIKASEEKFRLITENVSDIIWVINLSLDKITYISPGMTDISGYTVNEMKHRVFRDLVVEKYYDGFMDIISKNAKLVEESESNTFDRFEMQMKHRNGKITWTETVMKFYKNDQKDIIVICSTRNINTRKKDEEQIDYLLHHDSLTGFKNRRSFEKLLKEYDTKDNYPLTIIFSDINSLKLANDIFGHNAGDELIKKTAKGLLSIAREKDVFARIGGDEFVVLMPNTNFEEATNLVSDIKKALTKERIYAIQCNLSIGFDIKNNKTQKIETVKDNAESEMYKEKAASGKSVDTEMLKSILTNFYQLYPDEKLHSEYTANICEKIGRKLNLTGNEIYTLREAGRLHNVGKLPDSLKGIKIDPSDKSKRYPAISYRILNLFDETMDIADFVYQHKEHWDGSGYPKGLKGNEISLISQILSISDHYVSLITGMYGKMLSIEDAKNAINALSGINFNPVVVEAFNKYIEENK